MLAMRKGEDLHSRAASLAYICHAASVLDDLHWSTAPHGWLLCAMHAGLGVSRVCHRLPPQISRPTLDVQAVKLSMAAAVSSCALNALLDQLKSPALAEL